MKIFDKNLKNNEIYLRNILFNYIFIYIYIIKQNQFFVNTPKVNKKSLNKTTKIKTFGEQIIEDFKKLKNKTKNDVIEFNNWLLKNKNKLGLNKKMNNLERYNKSLIFEKNNKEYNILINYDISKIKRNETNMNTEYIKNNEEYDGYLDSRIYNDLDYKLDKEYFNKGK